MSDPQQTPPSPSKDLPEPAEAQGAAATPAVAPPWALATGLIRNRQNLIVLNNGNFTGITTADVKVCYQGKQLRVIRAVPAAGDPSRLIIRVLANETGNCTIPRPPSSITAGLTIQVKSDAKEFNDVVEEPENPGP